MATRYQFDRFEIQPAARVLLEAGTLVNLGARAFDLLVCLLERRDRVVGKEELIERVWPGLVVTDNNLNVQIAGLRKLLGAQSVQTVQGRGFRFALDVLEVRELPAASATGLRAEDVAQVARLAAVAEGAEGARTVPDFERRMPKPDLSLSAVPSIAVLPFINMGNDPQQDYFVDGITEDITTELSRFKAFLVIARNSSFSYKGRAVDVRTVSKELGVRYVVEGSVRRSDQRVRVAAQLIDAVTGNYLWTEKYDRVLEDMFDLQEEVTHSIVGAIAPQIHAAEQNMARRKRPGNLSAHDLAMRANANSIHAQRRNDQALWRQALAEARQALQMDPNSVLALTVIAELQARYVGQPQFEEQDLRVAWKEGVAAAGLAIDLDPVASPAYRWMGLLLALGEFHDDALDMARRGLDLNPNDALAWSNLAFVALCAGHSDLALAHQAHAIRLSPRDPNQYIMNTCRSVACFQLKDYAQALVYARSAVSEAPNAVMSQAVLTMAAAACGEIALAKNAFEVVRQLSPPFANRVLTTGPGFGTPEHRRRYSLALHIAAGLEDESAVALLR